MSTKRSTPEQERNDGTGRPSKRFKASPATPITSPLQSLSAILLKIIQVMPSDLIILGLDSVLNSIVVEDLLATPAIYNNTLEYINSQIERLTEAKKNGKVQAEYALLAEGMEVRLKGMLKRISLVR
jgi:hypothetical protein